jgi:hypothetical protein
MKSLVAVAFFALIAGPSEAPTAPACSSQIIMTFVQPLDGDPEESFVASLASAAGVQLAFLRSAGPDLHVFALAGSESDASCRDSLRRLRRDPRIRSAEIDVRRQPHG